MSEIGSLSKLKVFKMCAVAKIFQRYCHPYTWNYESRVVCCCPLRTGRGQGASASWSESEAIAERKPASESCYIFTLLHQNAHGTQNWDFTDLQEQLGSLMSFANRHLFSRYPHKM